MKISLSAFAVVVALAAIFAHVGVRAQAQSCAFQVSPVSIGVAADGQSGSIAIDTQPGCAWSAAVLTPASAPWIALDKTSGVGPATIAYTAEGFPTVWDGARMRQARVQVRWNTPTLGQDVVLTQQAGACGARFTPVNSPVSSVTFGALAGRGAFDVVANPPTSGAWFMESAADWIAMSPPSGIFGFGSGLASFNVAANPGAQARTATVVGCDGSRFTIRQAGRTAATGRYVPGDFDGDGRADLAIYRPPLFSTNGTWYVLQSGAEFSPAGAIAIDDGSRLFLPNAVVGDVDGDGRSDMIAYSNGSNFRLIRYSSDGYGAGTETVTPSTARETVVLFTADFDGSGKSSLATYDTSTGVWRTDATPGGARVLPETRWGAVGDVPMPGDYDGDGIADLAVWRPSEGRWFILGSVNGYAFAEGNVRAPQWGALGDIPVGGDFDGDGMNDPAVWRPSNGTWYVLRSSTGYRAGAGYQWGTSGDQPVPADYDGDGRTDLAVWRPSNGTWYLLFSSSGYAYPSARAFQWGTRSFLDSHGDRPIPRIEPPAPLRILSTCFPVRPGDRGVCFVVGIPGTYPESTGVQAFADLRIFGQPEAAHAIQKCIACGDPPTFDLDLRIPAHLPPGVWTFPIWTTDGQGRRADGIASITVVPR